MRDFYVPSSDRPIRVLFAPQTLYRVPANGAFVTSPKASVALASLVCRDLRMIARVFEEHRIFSTAPTDIATRERVSHVDRCVSRSESARRPHL